MGKYIDFICICHVRIQSLITTAQMEMQGLPSLTPSCPSHQPRRNLWSVLELHTNRITQCVHFCSRPWL